MRITTIVILFLTSSSFLISQNAVVQSFNYESTTRDTVISFPEGDHNKYEKILMHYAMRCKDGLVSTGAERNKGCGEWDYSCNTYIVDSTKVDSIFTTADEFNIPGYAGDVFLYSNEPTFDYFQVEQKEVTYVNLIFDKEYDVVEGTDNLDHDFGQAGSQMNLTYILTANDLMASGVEADGINGMTLPIEDGSMSFKNLRVKMLSTDLLEVNDEIINGAWIEVCNHNTTLSKDDNLIKFYEEFEYDGISNIAVNVSYDDAVGDDLNLQGQSSSAVYYSDLLKEQYMRCNPATKINASPNGLDMISNEITVSFWSSGANNLPTATTIVEGRDDSNLRQVNIHHPWGNGQIYWDCGNDGGGYDRINKAADPSDYKNNWNHWAFTKNAVTGSMKIYLNGLLWHSGTDKFKAIDVKALNVGGGIINESLSYYGGLDEVRIWNKELAQAEIENWMNKKIDSSHPDFNNLLLYYDFNEVVGQDIVNLAPNASNGTVSGALTTEAWAANATSLGGVQVSTIPNHAMRQDIVLAEVNEIVVLDSIPAIQQRVDQFGLNGTDLELLSTDFYYPAGERIIYGPDGVAVGVITIDPDGTIAKGELSYYAKFPMAFEIMSFVTPYGIGIDFGLDGHSWTFDVTDYGPILKGDKRIFMSRGGQWQEEMDISFEFIEGTPDREVIDIDQIWRVESQGYVNIKNDVRFEPRQFVYDPSVETYMIKTTITGHGQEGEFIPRNHEINIMKDGVEFPDTWQVWTECSDNAIYPQGGTWVYDRAGWCPGAPSDVREYDVTQFFSFFETPMVDYNVPVASGTSNYIVNSQLVKYGKLNKSTDLAIEDVIYPSAKVEHTRFNPTCQAPRILLKNHGEAQIESAVIKYGIAGKVEKTFYWNGNLSFSGTEEVTLGFLPALLTTDENDLFFAILESVNGTSDIYTTNNEFTSEIKLPDNYDGDVVLEFRTNSRPLETSYRVYDVGGTQLLYRGGNLNANTIYRDTLSGLNGCYRILVEDTDQDGLSWWANNDGSGYLRISEMGGAQKAIATDFGMFVDYNFSAGILSSNENLTEIHDVKVFPNPGAGNFFISDLSDWSNQIRISIVDQLGQVVVNQNMEKNELSSGVGILTAMPEGLYYINLSDDKKTTILKYVKKG